MTNRSARWLAFALAAAAVAGCGSNSSVDEAAGAPETSAQSVATAEAPAAPLTTPPDQNSTSDVAAASPATAAQPAPEPTTLPPPAAVGDLWQSYSSALSAAEEAEPAQTVKDLVGSADLIVLGTIVDVSVGRMIEVAPNAPSSRLQFANFEVSVVKSSGTSEALSFELPVFVNSPELEAAVRAAVDPEDSNGDGVIDDDEAARGYDADAVAKAYAEHWDQAVAYTIESAKQRVPAVDTLLFLRNVPTEGSYRPVNGDSIIINNAGKAEVPMRAEESSPIAVEVAGASFAGLVETVFAG
jgi:hypothetical protein